MGSIVFNEAGTFNYDCSVGYHAANGQTGTVIVLEPSNTVVDIVVGSETHTTLETAVTAAGLVETLSGEGPFTIFAPTDASVGANIVKGPSPDKVSTKPAAVTAVSSVVCVSEPTTISTTVLEGSSTITVPVCPLAA